jgi:hypothetical protein
MRGCKSVRSRHRSKSGRRSVVSVEVKQAGRAKDSYPGEKEAKESAQRRSDEWQATWLSYEVPRATSHHHGSQSRRKASVTSTTFSPFFCHPTKRRLPNFLPQMLIKKETDRDRARTCHLPCAAGHFMFSFAVDSLNHLSQDDPMYNLMYLCGGLLSGPIPHQQ